MKLSQTKYEEIVSNFKRQAGKLISQTFPHYGYDVYHPIATDKITGLLEEAIREVERYYEYSG